MAWTAVAYFTLFLVGLVSAQSPPAIGNPNTIPKPANAHIQQAVDAVANEIRRQATVQDGVKLTAQRYISEPIPVGFRYTVEVKAGPDRSAAVIHASITEDLSGTTVFSLNGVKANAIVGMPFRFF